MIHIKHKPKVYKRIVMTEISPIIWLHIKLNKLTWVTSAEVTHITTTAAMRNNPALYFQLITNQTRPRCRKATGIARDLRRGGGGPLRSLNLPSTFHRSPTCKNEIFEGGSERQIKNKPNGAAVMTQQVRSVVGLARRRWFFAKTKKSQRKWEEREWEGSVKVKFLVVFSS